jgi:glycosyltransferase involved in cell wall biosynthesis
MQDYKNILHISPHLGGGVGRVLINYLTIANQKKDFTHSILCLDSINDTAKLSLEKNQIAYKENMANNDAVLDEIAKADIVLIHWWNHPLLYNFLVKKTLPPSRIIFWSHVSGNEPPHLFSPALFEYPDLFIFTTPMSYLVHDVTNYSGDHAKFRAIWSTGGLDHIKDVKANPHDRFNIGYIGTVDFSKMYPNFISMCAKIDIPDVCFIICGGGSHIEHMIAEVKQKNLQEKFIFTGFINNIEEYLSIFDLFGYPLSQNHYGTCDQALAEAMGCEITPIVFDNNMESYMVHNLYSGIVVRSEEEYIGAIKELYKNQRLNQRLAKKAKEEAFRRFSIEQTIIDWENTYREIMGTPKTIKKWRGNYSGEEVKPFEVFLESIGKYSTIFESDNDQKIIELSNSSLSWKSKTKGSVHQYANFFRDDMLDKYSKLMS